MVTNDRVFNIPEKIDLILIQLELIQKTLEKKVPIPITSQTLNLSNAIALLSSEGFEVPKSTMYKLTSNGDIPFKKFGRKLVFNRNELLCWCKDRVERMHDRDQVVINLSRIANKKLNHGQ